LNQNDYPLILTAKHLSEILSISKRKAYEIMEFEGFPLVRLGRSKRVGRDAFFTWLENKEMTSKNVS
jgi:hypothetical protein